MAGPNVLYRVNVFGGEVELSTLTDIRMTFVVNTSKRARLHGTEGGMGVKK